MISLSLLSGRAVVILKGTAALKASESDMQAFIKSATNLIKIG